ncbi:hypothetical protein E2P81_ATG05188 [Venturia nashicola]|uniref:Uncharacterized protein n=1 Tax=Venturia nashicola TaxID=86259 RepID=A0A4Z1PF12_9PEZI|nr:hypothetical protein E6O75_ATG05316 [Venturia nashicola]TLD32212.1 hypothetical protein E2P81_ATG05188 [Venturia nashicola]
MAGGTINLGRAHGGELQDNDKASSHKYDIGSTSKRLKTSQQGESFTDSKDKTSQEPRENHHKSNKSTRKIITRAQDKTTQESQSHSMSPSIPGRGS